MAASTATPGTVLLVATQTRVGASHRTLIMCLFNATPTAIGTEYAGWMESDRIQRYQVSSRGCPLGQHGSVVHGNEQPEPEMRGMAKRYGTGHRLAKVE